MAFQKIWQFCFRILVSAFAFFAFSSMAHAQDNESRPLKNLGDAVAVTVHPIGEGERASFRQRRQDATKNIVSEVKKAYGEPLLADVIEATHILLVYPQKLVAITGRYSNGIICRIEIDAAALRLGFTDEQLVSIAARECRKSEEDGWGVSGLIQLTPLGEEAIPALGNAQAKVYASDQFYSLFPRLVREIEALSNERVSLVRQRGRDDPSEREGESVWRYAWYENGGLLILLYRQPNYSYSRARRGFGCSMYLEFDRIEYFSEEIFSEWCDLQASRLTPQFDRFFDRVKSYRVNLPPELDLNVPSAYGGFHSGKFPAELTERYWKTGEVSEP